MNINEYIEKLNTSEKLELAIELLKQVDDETDYNEDNAEETHAKNDLYRSLCTLADISNSFVNKIY